jgi:uncharacterized protein
MPLRIKSLLIGLFCIFILSLQAQEATIVLRTKSGEIEGTLSVPKIQNKTLVLIISGSGPTDRDGNPPGAENNSLKYFAQELAAHNIASVRFDKRGIGKSSDAVKNESELRFETYVNDIKDWIKLLSRDKRFNKIIIAGHSEGSLLGILAAQKNKKVAAFISIAGPGRPADQIIKEQLAAAPENVKTILYAMTDSLKAGKKISDVPRAFYMLFRPSLQAYMISWFKYDPMIEIKKLNIPALIIQGSTDLQVKVEDAQLLASGNSKTRLEIIEHMNHVLKISETEDKEAQKATYTMPEFPVHPEFIRLTTDFIKGIK